MLRNLMTLAPLLGVAGAGLSLGQSGLWAEDFDAYGPTPFSVNEIVGWAATPAGASIVESSTTAASAPNQLRLSAGGTTSIALPSASLPGQVFRFQLYIPSTGQQLTADEQLVLRLLCPDQQVHLTFDAATMIASSDNSIGTLPLLAGSGNSVGSLPAKQNEWAEVSVVFDTESDILVAYDGNEMVRYGWDSTCGGLTLAEFTTSAGAVTEFLVDDIVYGSDSPSPLITTNCQVNANSTGSPGAISIYGSGLRDGGLMLEASQLPTGQPGYFLASMGVGFIPNLGGGQGNLCLDPNGFVRMTQSTHVRTSSSLGRFAVPIAMADPLAPGYAGAADVMAGQTWYFQGWVRDHNPNSTSNLTGAVGFLFQ